MTNPRGDPIHRVPHSDLYELAELYDVTFSWGPEEKVQYLIELIKRFASIRLETAVFLDIGYGPGRVAYGL